MFLKDIEGFDYEDYENLVANKHVSQSTHAYLPVSILCYSKIAPYAVKEWSPTLMQCRGLIIDNETHEVLGRGPKKFFNLGENKDAPYTPASIRINDKVDGSLIIPFLYDGDVLFSTKRGMRSTQSEMAYNIFSGWSSNEKQFLKDSLEQGEFPVYELIHPDNRIVVDYGEEKSLRFLGNIDGKTGLIVDRPVTSVTKEVNSLQEVLAIPNRPNAEGFVLDYLNESGDVVKHVKLKQNDYVALHKIATNFSYDKLWFVFIQEFCSGNRTTQVPKKYEKLVGMDWKQFVSDLPDEFFNDADEYRESLSNLVEHATNSLKHVRSVTTGYDKKKIVEYLRNNLNKEAFSIMISSVESECLSKFINNVLVMAEPTGVDSKSEALRKIQKVKEIFNV